GGCRGGNRTQPQRGIGIIGRRHQDGSSHSLVVDDVAANGDRPLGGGVLGINRFGIGLAVIFCRSLFGRGVFGGILGNGEPLSEQNEQEGADEENERAGFEQVWRVPLS